MSVIKSTIFADTVFDGEVNVSDEGLIANINHSIRLGHPQLYSQPMRPEKVCIVGGGPSLKDTFPKLLAELRAGAKLLTLNGAYNFCMERNLTPSATLVLDARPSNARFVAPLLPECRYWIASQAHPDTWQAVSEAKHVGIWHAAQNGSDSPISQILDKFYLKQWHGAAGGTTVFSRGIGLARMLGYLRFEAFGIDSCFLEGDHHAFPQIENEADRPIKVTVAPENDPSLSKDFITTPWMLKQAEDVMIMIQNLGDNFLINFHGDGLISHMIKTASEFTQIVPVSQLVQPEQES